MSRNTAQQFWKLKIFVQLIQLSINYQREDWRGPFLCDEIICRQFFPAFVPLETLFSSAASFLSNLDTWTHVKKHKHYSILKINLRHVALKIAPRLHLWHTAACNWSNLFSKYFLRKKGFRRACFCKGAKFISFKIFVHCSCKTCQENVSRYVYNDAQASNTWSKKSNRKPQMSTKYGLKRTHFVNHLPFVWVGHACDSICTRSCDASIKILP